MTFSVPDISADAAAEPSQEADAHSIMAKLRLETSHAHLSIEQSPPMRAMFAEGYSLAEYSAVLARLLQFYRPFEDEVFGALPPHIATKIDHRRKTPLLRADLRALGAQQSGAVSDGSVPAFVSFEERMGGLYVLEGATLGGLLIRKHLLGQFGTAAASAMNFYSGYGKRANAEWQAFGSLMGGLFDRAGSAAQRKVVSGANATFSALERWLEGQPDPAPLGAAATETAR
jgi:heme oxygenase